jgi:tetratricopeptide (TPR) repeat protein
VLTMLGNTYNAVHDLQHADLLTGRALALDGSSAWAWGRSAWIESYRGQAESAIERFKIALELNPNDPLVPSLQVGLGFAAFNRGDYRESARWLERAVPKLSSPGWAHRLLCPTYVHLGLDDQAERSLSAFRREDPDATIVQVVSALPLSDVTRARFAEGLERAGLPLQ